MNKAWLWVTGRRAPWDKPKVKDLFPPFEYPSSATIDTIK